MCDVLCVGLTVWGLLSEGAAKLPRGQHPAATRRQCVKSAGCAPHMYEQQVHFRC